MTNADIRTLIQAVADAPPEEIAFLDTMLRPHGINGL